MHRIAKSVDHHASHSKRSSRTVATVRAMSDDEIEEADDDDAEVKVVRKVRRITHSHLAEKHHGKPRRHARTVAVVAADGESDGDASDASPMTANQAWSHQEAQMHRLFRSRSARRTSSHRSSRSRATVSSTDGESETEDISVPSKTLSSHRGESRMASEMGRDEETVGGRREVEAWVTQERKRARENENEGEEEEGVEATARQVEADAADPDMERGFDTPSDSDPMVVPMGLISKKGTVKKIDFSDRVS